MKNMVKKNQIMITALAIMIAVAGYLNFAGTKITDEEIMTTGADSAVISNGISEVTDDTDVAAMFEISDEDMEQAAIRELYEETGLRLTPIPGGCCSRPFFTTVGMTDESCGTVFGRCTGEPTNRHQEATEEIQVVLADQEECRRILREERVSIMCAYMLMHFVAGEEDPFQFLKSI